MNRKSDLENDLIALAALQDDEIDTTDIPERIDFSAARRAQFFNLTERNYDIRAIANWCLEKLKSEGRTETQMWLNKLVYFIHEISLTRYRTLLTPARVEAWDHGPVFREIYFGGGKNAQLTFFTKFNTKERRREQAVENFDSQDIEIFEEAWRRYGHLSASRLRALSHAPDSPWSLVWNSKDGRRFGLEIDIPSIIGRIGLGYGNQEESI